MTGRPEATGRPRVQAPSAPLLLASASPQRRALLTQVGIPFEARGTGLDELEAGEPEAVAEANAVAKARAGGTGAAPGRLVLGADTLVTIDGLILGKPAGPAQAVNYLERLSGRTHRVLGGIALVRDGGLVGATVQATEVVFRPFGRRLLDWYVACGEWEGRAGGYAIQGRGAALVAEVRGEYANVVGLPLARLLELAPELLPPAA